MTMGMKDAFERAAKKYHWHRFHSVCAPVMDKAVARCDPESSFSVLSMLQKKDLTMYLMAVKSFCAYLRPRAIYVLNDGTLGEPELNLLRQHLENPVFLRVEDFGSPHCPTGSCWERLLAVAHVAQEEYVIQLDSDLLFLSHPQEVEECISAARGFTLGDFPGQGFQPMERRVQISREKHAGNTHVQVVAESNFDQLTGYENLKYVRGCAGFAGFPKGSFTTEFVEFISAQMLAAIGGKWTEWGSEQVMSNIVVANLEHAEVLPFPKYGNCNVYTDDDAHTVVHFIGICRFANPLYRELGQRVLERLP